MQPPATPPPPSAATSAAPFLTQDAEKAYLHFATIVAPLPPDSLTTWRGDGDVVRVNVVRAVEALRPSLDQVKVALPRVSINELLELPSLALALWYAARNVLDPASAHEIRVRQDRVRPARSQTLRYLEIASELGLVPADRVKNIRAGTGALDQAHDAAAIVAMFHEFAPQLANKHPFSDELLDTLAADGNWLVQQLLPKNATPEGATAVPSPDRLSRDRLWTELSRRYDDVYLAGVSVWGRREVDAHIPTLQRRLRAAPGASETEPTDDKATEPAKAATGGEATHAPAAPPAAASGAAASAPVTTGAAASAPAAKA